MWAQKKERIVSSSGRVVNFGADVLTHAERALVTCEFVAPLLSETVTSIDLSAPDDRPAVEGLVWNPLTGEFEVVSDAITKPHEITYNELTNVFEAFTNSAFVAIADRCHSLESFNVRNCELFTDEMMVAIAANCQSLTSLDVRNCHGLTNEAIEAIAANCRSLVLLDVSECPKLTNQAIEEIAANCHSLTSLKVSRCELLTNGAIEAIAAKCHSLVSLDVSECPKLTNQAIEEIAANCHSLTSLKVSRCKELTNGAIEAIAAKCHSLVSLDVSGCEMLEDEAIVAIAVDCYSLTLLDVSGCDLLTNDAIEAIAINCRSLKSLHVVGCDMLTNGAMKAIAANCHLLESLNVGHCKRLKTEAMKAIADRCHSLTLLNVRACRRLTDEAIEAVTANCPLLASLNIDNCRALTNRAIEAVVVGCCALRYLTARDCSLTALPENISDRMPHLEILDVRDNNIRSLPRSLVKLEKLRELHAESNPLWKPPIEIATQGPAAIGRYYEEIDRSDEVIVTWLKLLLFGDAEAGRLAFATPSQTDRIRANPQTIARSSSMSRFSNCLGLRSLFTTWAAKQTTQCSKELCSQSMRCTCSWLPPTARPTLTSTQQCCATLRCFSRSFLVPSSWSSFPKLISSAMKTRSPQSVSGSTRKSPRRSKHGAGQPKAGIGTSYRSASKCECCLCALIVKKLSKQLVR